MRSIKKMGSVVGLAVAVAALAAASQSSAAMVTPSNTAFSGSNTVSTEHVFSISANTKVRCNQAKFTGTTAPASPTTSTESFTPLYGTATGVSGAWCRLYVGGTFTAATVAPSAAWSLTVNSYNDTNGVSTGTVTTSGATTITVGTCVITVPSGTTASVSGQNDQWNPAGAGVELTASGSGMSYTSSGCGAFGISSGTNATYSGNVYFANLFAML